MTVKTLTRTYKTTILADREGGSTMTGIDVPFDTKEAFGKVRAPVRVALNGYTFRSTTFRMGGETFVPLCRAHREAAGVRAGQTLSITLTLDDKPRVIAIPKDLAAALRKARLLDRFEAMSFTHRREYVEALEDAKKPETRQRRLRACIAAVKLRKPVAIKPPSEPAPRATRK